MKRTGNSGFTLIELLVVIAIIGMLSSVVLAALTTARAKSRDARRLSDLRTVQTALELYYNDNGHYPYDSLSNGWRGNSANCFHGYASSGSEGSIPDLAPTYVPTIPEESTPQTNRCYIYRSVKDDPGVIAGSDYKFMAYQTMETCDPGACPLQDPRRPGQRTSAVYSSSVSETW